MRAARRPDTRLARVTPLMGPRLATSLASPPPAHALARQTALPHLRRGRRQTCVRMLEEHRQPRWASRMSNCAGWKLSRSSTGQCPATGT